MILAGILWIVSVVITVSLGVAVGSLVAGYKNIDLTLCAGAVTATSIASMALPTTSLWGWILIAPMVWTMVCLRGIGAVSIFIVAPIINLISGGPPLENVAIAVTIVRWVVAVYLWMSTSFLGLRISTTNGFRERAVMYGEAVLTIISAVTLTASGSMDQVPYELEWIFSGANVCLHGVVVGISLLIVWNLVASEDVDDDDESGEEIK